MFRSQDRFFDKSVNLKIGDIIIDKLQHMTSYNLDYFFRNLGSIKMKFGQMLVQLMTINISNSLLSLL